MSLLTSLSNTVSNASLVLTDDTATNSLTAEQITAKHWEPSALTVDTLLPNSAIQFSTKKIDVTCGTSNVFIGADLPNNDGKGGNVAIGLQAGQGLTTGNNNVLIGEAAGTNAGIHSGNVAIGVGAMTSANIGDANVCFGTGAGAGSLGFGNVCMGVDAGSGGLGNSNTVIGYAAGSAYNVGEQNFILGNSAALSSAVGDNNVLLGAGSKTLGALNNTFALGTNCETPVSNCIAIGRQTAPIYSAYTNIVLGNAPGGGTSSSCVPGPYSSDKRAYAAGVPYGGLYYNSVGGKSRLCICLRN